ncbi:MAG: 50S ribosomal protein L21 [Chloroflexota bacterium]|nr:50S ribosomal protein L21 [Chloroflexota bacterium]
MQAVVRTGGKQYRVEEGALVTVDRLAGEPGSSVTLGDVLLLADGDRLGRKGTVTAEIVGHEKGDKVKVLKYKNKVRYRKLSGQRQLGTKLRITKIEAEA